MKQTTIAIALLLALGSTSPMMAQSHRHTPRASVQINAQQNGNKTTATLKVDAQDQGVDAYSDTTDVDSANVDTAASNYDEDDDFSVRTPADDWSDFSDSIKDSIVELCGVIVIFLLTPVLIIGLICYFLYKYRKQKIRLAELALEKGQPIPDGVINESKPKAAPQTKAEAKVADQETAAKGIKNAFLGIGIAILGVFIDASFITGVGFLVACMGAGQFATAYFYKKQGIKQQEEPEVKPEEPKETDSHDLITNN